MYFYPIDPGTKRFLVTLNITPVFQCVTHNVLNLTHQIECYWRHSTANYLYTLAFIQIEVTRADITVAMSTVASQISDEYYAVKLVIIITKVFNLKEYRSLNTALFILFLFCF